MEAYEYITGRNLISALEYELIDTGSFYNKGQGSTYVNDEFYKR